MNRIFVFTCLAIVGATRANVWAQSAAPIFPATAATARAEIQVATDSLNDALKRDDADAALHWLAPDFELGERQAGARQYRVRDLAWMRQALPLQLERAYFERLSVKISTPRVNNGLAYVEGTMEAYTELKDKSAPDELRSWNSSAGLYDAQWIKTANGWRCRRNDSIFDLLLWASAPPAPRVERLPDALPDSPAANLELALQNPLLVVENRSYWGNGLAFSFDGSKIAHSYDPYHLRVTSAQTGETIKATSVSKPLMFLWQVAYDRNGSLWTTSADKIVRKWDVASGTVSKQWTPTTKGQHVLLSVAPDSRTFAVILNTDRVVQLWDAENDRELATFKLAVSGPYNTKFSPDGTLLAVDTYVGAEIYDARDGRLLRKFNEKWGGFLPDSKTVALLQYDGRRAFSPSSVEFPKSEGNFLRFRSIADGALQREIAIPPDREKMVNLLPIGVLTDPQTRFQLQQGAPIADFSYPPIPVIAPNGQVAASVYADGSLGIWNTKTGQVFRVLRGFSSAKIGRQPDLVFSPDSQTLAVNSRNGEIALWNVSLPQPK